MREPALPPLVDRAVRAYLRDADRLVPGRLAGFYLVGSVALGAFRPNRSDIDFVAVVDRGLEPAEITRLRTLHVVSGLRFLPRAARHGPFGLPGGLNGVFVRTGDLAQPVTAIVPVASQTGHAFQRGAGFDVNPVVWKVLADRGIAVRGPHRDTLNLDPQPELLAVWNQRNLVDYWRPWAESLGEDRRLRAWLRPRWTTAWGVLGATRLHHTIATGEIISKEGAGAYACEAFDGSWQPIIREGLAYWRGEPPDPAFRRLPARLEATAAFVLQVVDSATRSAPG